MSTPIQESSAETVEPFHPWVVEDPSIQTLNTSTDVPPSLPPQEPEGTVRSTPIWRLALQERHRIEREMVAPLEAQLTQLEGTLDEKQEPYRDNPELLIELLTGDSAADRLEVYSSLNPTQEAIARVRADRNAAQRRGNAALRFAYNHYGSTSEE